MRYGILELGQAGKPACPDKYNEESTLICPRSTRLVLQVAVAAVYVQLGLMPQGVQAGFGSVMWQTEDPYLPLVASLARKFDAVRIRNWQPGVEAQVFLNVA